MPRRHLRRKLRRLITATLGLLAMMVGSGAFVASTLAPHGLPGGLHGQASLTGPVGLVLALAGVLTFHRGLRSRRHHYHRHRHA